MSGFDQFAPASDVNGRTSGEPDVATYRLFLGIAAALVVIFWGAYRVSEPAVVDPLWGRLLVAAIPTGLIGGSYVSVIVRTHMRALWRAFLYLTVAWFTGLAVLNHFHSAYGLGALFVVAATDAGFALGLRRLRPMGGFLIFTVVVPSGAILLTPGAATNRVIFICGLASLAVIFCLILWSRVHALRWVEASRREAEAASRLKSTIIGNVSHEFRTPLTSILGFAEIIAEEGSEMSRNFACSIQTSARRLRRTLNNMVDLARLEAGEAHLDGERVAVDKKIVEVVDAFSDRAEEKGVDLTIDILEEPPIDAYLSAAALDRIVSNLVDNAIKFTECGCVTVTVRRDEDGIEIAVADTGIGMDDATRSTLFEEFRQASEGVDREYEGLGLGLKLVAHLVNLMQGRVRVESEQGKGSQFYVWLPTGEEAPRRASHRTGVAPVEADPSSS